MLSVSPSSGTGSSQTFTFVYSDSNGASDLASAQAIVNTAVGDTNSCYVWVTPGSGAVWLAGDTGAWSTQSTLGTAGTLQNSQCVLNVGASIGTLSGNTYTLSLVLTFQTTFTGTKNVYGLATTQSALTSGWQTLGAWTVGTQPPPQAVSVSPSSGTAYSQSSQTFTFAYSDINGAPDLASAQALVNASITSVSSCYVWVTPGSGAVWLAGDTGVWSTQSTLGTAGTLQNSQCVLNVGASSGTLSGNTYTLSLVLTFQTAFAGTKNVYGLATTQSALTSGWQTLGTWTVESLAPSDAGPSNVGMTPSSGSGPNQKFSFTSSSPNGSFYISSMQMVFNYGLDGDTACYLQYSATSNQLYLNADLGGWGNPATVGQTGAATLSNSQCQVDVADSSFLSSGETLTLSLVIKFKPAFVGPQNVYLTTYDLAAQSANWQQMGTWTDYAPQYTNSPPTATVTPIAGTSLRQIFTYTVTDMNGYSYIPYIDVLFNTAFSGLNACYLVYSQADQLFELYNDPTTSASTAAPGSATLLSNSQCQLNVATSTVSESLNNGSLNNLVVSFDVTFFSGFAGAKNNYVQAADHAGYAVWQNLGTWTVAAPNLSVSSTHIGNFTPGQSGATYTLAVSNQSGAGATSGTVTVADTLPIGLTLVSMTGTGWSCAGNTCTESTALAGGSSYPPITVTVNVAASAGGAVTNLVSVSGGGSAMGTGSDPTAIPDFTINLVPASATSGTVMVGGAATYTVTVGPVSGGTFNGTVALTALGLPSGFSTSFSPATICLPAATCGGSGTSTLTVTTPASGTGNLSVAVNGSSGSLSHNSVPAALAMQDFTITLSPYNNASPPVITAGGSQTFTISAAGVNGFTGNIQLTLVLTNPPGISNGSTTCGITGYNSIPSQVATGSAVTMILTPSGLNCSFQIDANANIGSHVVNGSITVASSASFGFTLPPTQGTLTATPTTLAATVEFTPTLTIVNNFCGTINFQVTGLPAGVTFADTPAGLCASGPQLASITVTVPPGTPQSISPIPLTIQAFGVSGDAGVASNQYIYPYLQVGAGGSTFSISTSPPQTTSPGGTAQYTVTVSGSAGLGNVILTATGGPPGSTVLLNGASSASVAVGGTATLTVATSLNAGTGTYPVSITGMLGTVPKYATASTNIAQAAPASIISPTPGQISSGQSTFTWNSGIGATQYQLTVGSSVGGTNYYSASLGSAQSASVNIPSGASAAYVTLSSLTPVGWLAQSYVYGVPAALGSVMQLGAISLQPSAPAVTISSPVPSDTITGCSVPSAGVTAVIAGAAGSQTVTFTASATAQLGTTNIACSTAARNTLQLTANIETYADGISFVSTTWNGGGSYTVSISGFGFGDDGDVYLSGDATLNGVTWNPYAIEIDMSVPDGVCSTTFIELDPDGSEDPDGFAPAPLEASVELCPDVAPPPPTECMALSMDPTVISTDGNYSEDTTVHVTAKDCGTGATIPDFVGTVDIQEDTTIPGYVQIYNQNGGTLPPSVNITAGAGGTAFFVAKSLAGPLPSNEWVGPAPTDAVIETTNYPLYIGVELPIPQWINSGTKFDPHAILPAYDWFQHRTSDIFANYTANDPAVRTAFISVKNYTVGVVVNSAGTPLAGQVLSGAPNTMALNPFSSLTRTDGVPVPMQTCGSFVGKELTTDLIHEARHTYQFAQAAIAGNDFDKDFLVNAIDTAPNTIFLDTTTFRTVCNEYAAAGVPQLLSLAYQGDRTPDPPPNSTYALEMDAWVFSTGHAAGITPPGLTIAATHTGIFTQSQMNAALTLTVSNLAGFGPTSGTVTVTEYLPSGLALVGMAGAGWVCGATSCTRADALGGNASYPPIAVTVNVAASAVNQLNVAGVSGGGSLQANATDSITVIPQ